MSRSLDGNTLLLGEAKWSARPWGVRELERAASELLARPTPSLPPEQVRRRIIRALFVPALDRHAVARASRTPDLLVVRAGDLLA